jgi:hypothetical protein
VKLTVLNSPVRSTRLELCRDCRSPAAWVVTVVGHWWSDRYSMCLCPWCAIGGVAYFQQLPHEKALTTLAGTIVRIRPLEQGIRGAPCPFSSSSPPTSSPP